MVTPSGPRILLVESDSAWVDVNDGPDWNDEQWWPEIWLPPTLFDEEGRRLWIEEMDFDPRPVFGRVRVPTLLFYGEDDSWTPVEPSVEAWRAARGDEVDIVVIAGVEHDLTLPDGSLSSEYERILVDWLAWRRN